MFLNRNHQPYLADNRQARMKLTSVLTCGILALMVMTVIAGFVYIDRQQEVITDVRTEARLISRMRHAIIQTNKAVQDLALSHSENPDFSTYARALNFLNAQDTQYLPKTVQRGTDMVPATQVLQSFKNVWADIIAAINVGQYDRARTLYVSRDIETPMANLFRAMGAELDNNEQRSMLIQQRIDLATMGALVLQVFSGIVCILAFFFAARNGARDAKARDRAVTAANASREQVSRLFEMTDMLQSAADHNDANEVLRATAAELIPNFGGALYVFSNSRDRLTISTTWSRDERVALPESIGLQQCWALKRGKPHLNQPETVKLCCEHHTSPENMLEIPMIARGEILGLMQIFADGSDAADRLRSIASIGTALADAMSLALANIALRDKLRSQALRDPLTGLYNRRYMEDALERVVRLGEREKNDVSVIMIDLDHFKRLNDQHGHAKGDTVLRDAAAAIVNQLRETDIACRYGGEELFVVLPNCGIEAAAAKAERIRASIEALSEPKGASVSASFGVASAPATATSARDLLTKADAALYQAKQEGRNRVVRAPTLATPMPSDTLEQLQLAAE
jgi:diguanylate cyclase (GGDEF)-like protein